MRNITIVVSVPPTDEYKVIRDKALEEGFKSLNRYEFSQIWTDGEGNDIAVEFFKEGEEKLCITLVNSWRKDQQVAFQKSLSINND